MYENEIYSSDRTDNHTTGAYQSYNMGSSSQGDNGSHIPQEPEKKKSGGFVRKMMLCACLGLCFGLFGGLGLYAVQQVTGMTMERPTQETGNVQNAGTPTAAPISDVKLAATEGTRIVSSDVSDVVEDVMPAMVAIVKDYTETASSFWGSSYSRERQGSGSGIIVAQNDTELVLVTNHHVVDGANKLTVTFIDGSTAEAQIKGSDADMDLAVIAIPIDRLDEETRNSITVAQIGDSESLRMGEQVIAIGNALGYGQSMSGGWISALNREVSFSDGSTGRFIQTDAAINPGNSGGALVNMNGEVIGINSSKIGGEDIDGIGFAIPISAARPIIEDLMTKETRFKVAEGETGYMGVSMQAMREEHSYLGIPKGMLVTDVEEGSPAEKGGILRGDVITRFEGERIESYEDLKEIMQYYGPDTKVTVVVKRLLNGSYEDVELELTLGRRP